MFPQQPQQQFRTASANVQQFYKDSTWVKPPGVSHVYMMLIGGGGSGTGGFTGGGSGAVTVWYGAAQHVPNNLVVSVSTGADLNTTINYRSTSGLVVLLTANAGGAATGLAGAASPATTFAASGFYRSTAGQGGFNQTPQTASATTFLSGGNTNDTMASNYGYTRPVGNSDGFFILQPLIVGSGGSATGAGGIGCGGGATGVGSPGLVLIASW